MSRIEQRNIVILVAVVAGLLAGVAVLANYSGILRADTQEQPAAAACTSEGKACTHAEAQAGAFPNVFASAEAAPAGGCCPGEKPTGCCEKPPAGCCEEAPAGCCEKPHEPGCCPAKAEAATE